MSERYKTKLYLEVNKKKKKVTLHRTLNIVAMRTHIDRDDQPHRLFSI